ncbi:MAG: DUF4174 domain-containing protein [Deltaproteobacteria bacterium]|nr:MAG: DUF4174 domain-containing protein [Deltaproteobacteria bacterium]
MAMRDDYLYPVLLLVAVNLMATKGYGQDRIRLDDYRWRNRLIVAFAPSSDDPGYKALSQTLAIRQEEVIDRDILVFHILETGEVRRGNANLPAGSGDYLKQRYSIEPGKFTALLIGKDGGEKLRREDRVELDEVFSLIDSMPMRQREMREKASNR